MLSFSDLTTCASIGTAASSFLAAAQKESKSDGHDGRGLDLGRVEGGGGNCFLVPLLDAQLQKSRLGQRTGDAIAFAGFYLKLAFADGADAVLANAIFGFTRGSADDDELRFVADAVDRIGASQRTVSGGLASLLSFLSCAETDGTPKAPRISNARLIR